MRALTVRQPWANLISSGRKTIETRKRRTHHRGPLLICAAKPDGVALCIVDVLDCRPMQRDDWAAACCEPYDNAFAWILGNVRRIEPFAVTGRQGMFHVELPELPTAIRIPPLRSA